MPDIEEPEAEFTTLERPVTARVRTHRRAVAHGRDNPASRRGRPYARGIIDSMDVMPLATLSGLLLAKEIGIPIPVPGDLLVLGAGAATSGRPEALAWLLAILIAGYVGGTIQFLLVRGAMRRPLLAFLARLGVPQTRVERLSERLRTGGPRAVAAARATPGLRMAVIAASGVAALPARTFLPGFIAGNTVFVGGHFAVGFVLGKTALEIASELGNPAVLGAILIALSAAGAVAWILIRRRSPGSVVKPAEVAAANSPAAAPAAAAASSDSAAAVGAAGGGRAAPARHLIHAGADSGFATWADAACPVCLALAAARVPRPS